MSKCIFCEAEFVAQKNHERRKTKEHIFPKWLLDKYSLSKTPLEFSSLEAISEDGVSLQLTPPKTKRSLTLNTFVLGNVCAHCNNGWMADLEGCVKEDLIKTHDGTTLPSKSNKTLAIWCAKTAFVLSSYLNPEVGALPQSWGRWLSGGRSEIPPDSAIFFSSVGEKSYWFSIPSTHQVRSDNEILAREVWQNSAKVVFQLGQGIFQVVWSSKASSVGYNISDSQLLQNSIKTIPNFGTSVRSAGISDELFIFMMSNELIA